MRKKFNLENSADDMVYILTKKPSGIKVEDYDRFIKIKKEIVERYRGIDIYKQRDIESNGINFDFAGRRWGSRILTEEPSPSDILKAKKTIDLILDHPGRARFIYATKL